MLAITAFRLLVCRLSCRLVLINRGNWRCVVRGLPVELVQGMRPTCFNCFRPSSHCLCSLIPQFHAHFNLLILQHPHERKKYYSTARMVNRAIENSHLVRGLLFDESELEPIFSNQKVYLLFPGEGSQDCQQVSLDQDSTVVVLDGTWSEAGKIFNRNAFLGRLPRLTFTQPFRSNYRIRKQPRDHYLSTLESIGHLLTLSASAQGLDAKVEQYKGLFQGFDRMVERQLSYFPRMRNQSEISEV